MIRIVVDDIFQLLLLLVPVVALSWVSLRLLGVRRSWIGALVISLVGWVLGVLVAALSYQSRRPPSDVDLAVRVGAFTIVATMAVAVAAELVFRPSPRRSEERLGRLPRVPHPVRRVQQALAPSLRFQQVLRIARRNGLLHPRFASTAGIADPDFGPRLRATLEECGGMFVKLGQVASTRGDLLPAPLVAQLTQLQASVAPESPEGIRTVLEEELGRPVEEVFHTFEWEPLAAASIGQVHRATLATAQDARVEHSATEHPATERPTTERPATERPATERPATERPATERVVVKVQRPGIADVVARDTQAMLSLARFIQRRTRLGLRVEVVSLVHEFTDAIRDELDFTAEARSEARVRENRVGDRGVRIPVVHADLSTRRLLVLEEMRGRSIADASAVDGVPVPRAELADRLLASFLAQMLTDGVFHADPHPGNILVDADGTLALLDFGSTGVLDALTLQALGGMLLATQLNDPVLLKRSVLAIAPPPAGTDTSGLESDLGRFLAVHLDRGGGIDVGMFEAMIRVLRRNHLQVPHSFTLLARALLTLDGTLRTLCPGYPTAQQATALARPLVAPADGDALEDQLRQELLRSLPSLRTLPDHAEVIANQLRTGQLSVRTRRYADPREVVFVRSLVNRAVLAAVGVGGLVVSALLLLVAAQDPDARDAALIESIGFVGLFVASIVTLRVVALVVRDEGRE